MNTSSITKLFKAVELALITLTAKKELQNKMNAYNFTPKRVQEGNTLLNNARLLHSTQEDHYDEARRISLQIKQDNHTALEVFRDHVAIAKSAFRKEPLLLQELHIQRLENGIIAMTEQAMDFYKKAPTYMIRLQPYGASVEAFEQNKAAIEALVTLRAQRQMKKGDAEHSTQEKNQAIKALRDWYGEFRKLARIAFQDTPQVLETFGIVVPSAPKKRKATGASTAKS